MLGSRHPRRRSAPAFALLSVLALLALSCFPVAAGAETVYESEETTIPGEVKPDHHKATNNPQQGSSAEKSTSPGGAGESDHGSSENGSAVKGGGDDTGQGSQQNGTQAGDGSQTEPKVAAVGSSKPLTAANPTSSTDDGSSSPLVPILIAVAALAAISIGAVVVRQRRQGGGPGSSVSPKAS